jgi:hypothetical protein
MINQIVYGVITSLAILGLFTQLAWFSLPIAYGQQQTLTLENTYVKITSPSADQQVSAGPLTINGISSDTGTTDCEVYVDWNDLKPYQKVVPAGPLGQNDYSNWTFTYTDAYHLITEGTNELTSKISCYRDPVNITKHNSINVTGLATSQAAVQELPSVINGTDAEGGLPSSPPTPSSSQLPSGPSSDTGISTEEETGPPPSPPSAPVPNGNEDNGESSGDEGEDGDQANDEDIGDLFR